MPYKIGTQVFSDGNFVGEIRYLIVDPRSREITHLVIGDADTKQQKILALEQIEIRTIYALIIPQSNTWQTLPDYHPEYYEPADAETSYLVMPLLSLHPLYYYPPLEPQVLADAAARQVGIDTAVFQPGASVYDSDKQPCGEVVTLDIGTDGNLSNIVIQILNERRIHAPLRWVLYTDAENIYLNVNYSRFAG